MKTETILLVFGGIALLLLLMHSMKPPPPPPSPPQNALSGLGSIVGAVTGIASLF